MFDSQVTTGTVSPKPVAMTMITATAASHYKLAMTRSVSDASLCETAENSKSETLQVSHVTKDGVEIVTATDCNNNTLVQRLQLVHGLKLTNKNKHTASQRPTSSALVGKPLPAAPVLPSMHNPAPPVAPIFLPIRQMLQEKRCRPTHENESGESDAKRFKKEEDQSSLHDLAAVAALSKLRFQSDVMAKKSTYSPLPPPPGLVELPTPF